MTRSTFKPMTTASSALIVLALMIAVHSVAAQQPGAPLENCNQPMTEPITHVPAPGLAALLAPTRDGCWLFAGFVDRDDIAGGSGISLMRRKGETFEEIRTVPLPLPRGPAGAVPGGLALTPDEQVLIVSHSQRVSFLDVEKIRSGGDPTLGHIEGPRIAVSWGLTITQDGKYAFAAQMGTAAVAMIDVARARASGFDQTALKGVIPTSPTPIGLAVSPDGRYLAVTNRLPPDVLEVPRTCNGGKLEEGAVQIVDLERAKADVSSATVGWAAPAGCGPQSVAISPDGTRLSATAGFDPAVHLVVVFDARPLREGKMPEPTARIPMPAPAVRISDAGKWIIVGFSEIQKPVDDSVNVLVIDPLKVGAGSGAIIGKLPFPATFLRLTEDSRTLFASRPGTISIVDLERVQLQPAASKE